MGLLQGYGTNMRNDSVGLFWQDLPSDGKRGAVTRVMPAISETGWLPPTSFPDFSNAPCIAVDTETYDPDLLDFGPGWARGVGHLIGVSIAAPGMGKWYFPIRHEVCSELNLDPEKVLLWLKHTLGNPKQPKIGANIMYDIGWLRQEGVIVRGQLYDVQAAEALLSESSKVSLDILGEKYLGEGKMTNLLYKWSSDFYGGAADGKQRANLYRCPPQLVGPYAESDADLPLRIIEKQWGLLEQEGLLPLFIMECKLIYLLVEMRFAGVSVDVKKASLLQDELTVQELARQKELDYAAGFSVNVNASESLARLFDKFALPYPKTTKGAPSFTKGFLEHHAHPIAQAIIEVRKYAKLRGTFVESYILDSHINGKVYGQFHLLRGDSDGTRSGRFSSSTPNLQNIPSRDDILAPMIRGLFIPDAGHKQWRKYDYSQIEYRFLAHYAVGELSDEVRRIFNADPNTDYHEMTRELIKRQVGVLLERKPTKTINFGLIYGMGVPKLAASLGLSSKQGKELFAAYHRGAPFAKATMEAASKEALTTGVITTMLGRKSRFDLWEPEGWGESEGVALPYHQAIQKWGKVRRAYAHKALNRRLQGSAADMMKYAMLKCWEDGVFDATGVPRLTVHDELDFSDTGHSDSAFEEMRRILENSLKLRVPVIADYEVGPDWGHVK